METAATTTQSKTTSHHHPKSGSKNSSTRRGGHYKHQQNYESPDVRRQYADQLSHHEWMVSIPHDFSHQKKSSGGDTEIGWFVSPRPEGRRCLITAHGGETITRDKNGTIISRFQSALPHGSRRGRSKRGSSIPGESSSFGSGYSILDCILQEEEIHMPTEMSSGTFGLSKPTRPKIKRTYWIVDLMCWKGYSLYDCNVAFRTYWSAMKMAEEIDDQTHAWTSFKPIPRYECTTEGLQRSYNPQNVPYRVDGLLFMHRNGHYDPGPHPTPLVLVWKDSQCGASHFVSQRVPGSESTASSSSSEDLIILHASSSGALLTQDEVQLGSVDASSSVSPVSSGAFLKFKISGICIDSDGNPVLISPVFMGQCSKHRTSAHSMSRIMFHHGNQSAAAVQIPSIEMLAQVAETPILVEVTADEEAANDDREAEEEEEEDEGMSTYA